MAKIRLHTLHGGRRLAFFGCPACRVEHAVTVKEGGLPGGPLWHWDGDMEAPTFSPSVNVRVERVDRTMVCHSFVRAGRIEYLGDCTHSMAGSTVELPDLDGA